MATATLPYREEIEYPESDGKPVAESEQREYLDPPLRGYVLRDGVYQIENDEQSDWAEQKCSAFLCRV